MVNKVVIGSIIFLLTLILILPKISNGQDTTIYKSLSSYNPNDNDDDLKQLDNYFENVTVVGMGESTHGTHEFFTMRHRIFKYLVENHQFNTFFLEADYANCLRVNDYIHGNNDNAIEAVSAIDMWPWKTTEMVALVVWMREYNIKNPTKQLNFIGVDAQRYIENIEKMDAILAKYELPTTDSIIYKRMLATNFFLVTEIEDLEIYKTVWEEKKTIDTYQLNKKDKRTYGLLLRHLTQTLGAKYKWQKHYDYRDRRMAENILYHLKEDSINKGFFWAHNGHVFNSAKENKRKKVWTGSAGGILKHELENQFFIIGQEFDEGSFNAYYPDSNSTTIIEGKAYALGSVKVRPAEDGSFAANYRHLKKPVFFEVSSLPKKEYVSMTFIGAVYSPERDGKPKSLARNNHHGKKGFDAIILIKKSTPTNLLD
jgi:erythromycin esterase